VLNDRGPNDLEVIIEKLRRQNETLKMEVDMLKEDIIFLRKELQNRKVENGKSVN
jgi:hypothetical protein